MCAKQHQRAQTVDHALHAHLFGFLGAARDQHGDGGRAPDAGEAAKKTGERPHARLALDPRFRGQAQTASQQGRGGVERDQRADKEQHHRGRQHRHQLRRANHDQTARNEEHPEMRNRGDGGARALAQSLPEVCGQCWQYQPGQCQFGRHHRAESRDHYRGHGKAHHALDHARAERHGKGHGPTPKRIPEWAYVEKCVHFASYHGVWAADHGDSAALQKINAQF